MALTQSSSKPPTPLVIPARSESEFIIDTQAPIVEQLLIAGDNKINAAEAALELLPVEGTIAGAEEGQIISLTIDEVAAEASVDSVGDFMVDVNLSSLSADGSYIVTATVSDIAATRETTFHLRKRHRYSYNR